MASGDKLEFGATLEAAQAADYLSRIADGLRQGTISLNAGGRVMRLDPAEVLKIEIEAETRPDKGKGSLALELSWRTRSEAEAAPSLEIIAGPADDLVAASEQPEDGTAVPA